VRELILSEVTINTKNVYNGKLLKLHVDTVRLPDGRETTKEIVEHPGAVAIIPILDNGKLLVVKQYRTAARRRMMEIPAGTLEADEAPLACAKRELIEETGYAAGRFTRLFSCYLAPGYSSEKIHFFLARRLVKTKVRPAEDEFITVRAMDLDEALRAIERGKIQDAKTISALYYLAMHRDKQRRPSKSRRRRSTE
jgi:ADP-ribose pyrophosphatase